MSDLPPVAVSGDTTKPGERPVVDLVNHMAMAWNKGDATSFAGVFGEQADFINLMGDHLAGRDAIEQLHRTLFSTAYAGSRIQYQILKVKPVGQGATLVFLHQRVAIPRGDQTVVANSRPTLVLRGGPHGLRIAMMQNTLVATQPGVAQQVMQKVAQGASLATPEQAAADAQAASPEPAQAAEAKPSKPAKAAKAPAPKADEKPATKPAAKAETKPAAKPAAKGKGK